MGHKIWFSLAGVVGGFFLILLSLFFLPWQDLTPAENQAGHSESQSAPQDTSLASAEEKLTVEVQGAVVRPGVYQLPINTRVVSLIRSAGGFSRYVDRVWLAQELNQAAPLQDGDKIYIQAIGDIQTKSTQKVAPKKSAVKKKTTNK